MWCKTPAHQSPMFLWPYSSQRAQPSVWSAHTKRSPSRKDLIGFYVNFAFGARWCKRRHPCFMRAVLWYIFVVTDLSDRGGVAPLPRQTSPVVARPTWLTPATQVPEEPLLPFYIKENTCTVITACLKHGKTHLNSNFNRSHQTPWQTS